METNLTRKIQEYMYNITDSLLQIGKDWLKLEGNKCKKQYANPVDGHLKAKFKVNAHIDTLLVKLKINRVTNVSASLKWSEYIGSMW